MANVGVRPSSGWSALASAGEIAVDELALQRDGGRGDDDRGVLLDGVVDRGHEVGQRLAGAGARLHGHVLAGGDRRAHGLRHRVLAFPAGAPDGGDGGFEELADPGELGGRHGSEATGCPRRVRVGTGSAAHSGQPSDTSAHTVLPSGCGVHPCRSASAATICPPWPRPSASCGWNRGGSSVASHTSTRTNSWPSRSVTRSGGRACSTRWSAARSPPAGSARRPRRARPIRSGRRSPASAWRAGRSASAARPTRSSSSARR